MALTLTKITNTIKAPLRKVLDTDLRTLFYDNPAALDLWIWGSRKVAGVTPPHDHALGGAEILKGSLLSLSFGPWQTKTTGGSSWLRGIPLTRGWSTLTTAKLVFPALCTLPGGVARVRGSLFVWGGTAGQAVNLTATLRPVQWHNAKYLNPTTTGVHASADLTWTASAAQYQLIPFSFEALNLNKAKPLDKPARVELCLFQKTVLPGAVDWMILGAELWVDDDPATYVRAATPSDPPKAEVTFSDILANKLLLTLLSKKFKSRWNGLLIGLLGRAPGIDPNGVDIDRDRRWVRRIKGAHRHEGLIVPDSQGAYYSDGACLTYPSKATACWPRTWGEGASSLRTCDARQPQGELIHSGGALDGSWLSDDYSIDLEAGLAAIDMQVSLEPANTETTPRLFCHVGVYAEQGSTTNLVKAVSCDWHRQEAVDAGGLLKCEVEPEENDSWVPNANMRLAAKGVYTQLAKKPASQTYATETINAYRVSKVIKVEISHPAYQTDGVARKTGRYILRVRWSLFLSGSSYDAGALKLAFEAVASKGY